ncbi:MAG: EVE domain-containing protein [Deltaproteobacteria bacterium]|nr:EVE domain-containing protein [Deltaproteobacteria bacterium]
MSTQYWLVKTEPDVFSIHDLEKAKGQTTGWEGVRNYLARNYLRAMKQGDGVLVYHSSSDAIGVAGTAEVAREAFPDLTALDKKSDYYDAKATKADPRWSSVELRWTATFPAIVPLERLRKERKLAGMQLLKQGNRLSVMPVTQAEWRAILALAKR